MNHFKKTNKKLEKLRAIFFQLGLVIACGLSFLAFEWKTSTTIVIPEPEDDTVITITDLPPITFQNPPEKPKVKIIALTPPNNDVIDIIDDNTTDLEPTPDVDVLPDFIPDDYEPVTAPPKDDTPFRIVEKMPEYVGGEKERRKFLKKNIKYPVFAKEAGIEGTVHLQFVVNKKGEIKNIEVVRGVNDLLDKEAIRVLKAMPKWKPGKQRGKPVKVILNMPIKFELR